MTVPVHLRDYPCGEYFASGWAETGLWDGPSQTMLILPAPQIEERPELPFLVVSRLPGGVVLGYRPGHPGFWAYTPEVGEFGLMTQSITEFVELFYAGRQGI